MTGVIIKIPWSTWLRNYLICHVYVCLFFLAFCMEKLINNFQNNWDWKGPLEVPCYNPTAQAGPLRTCCLAPCPVGFWVSPGVETPQLHWAPVPVLGHSYCSGKNKSSDVCSCFVPIVTGHHWMEPGSIFLPPLFKVFMCIGEISAPQPFLLQAKQFKLSQPFLIAEILKFYLCGLLLGEVNFEYKLTTCLSCFHCFDITPFWSLINFF